MKKVLFIFLIAGLLTGCGTQDSPSKDIVTSQVTETSKPKESKAEETLSESTPEVSTDTTNSEDTNLEASSTETEVPRNELGLTVEEDAQIPDGEEGRKILASEVEKAGAPIFHVKTQQLENLNCFFFNFQETELEEYHLLIEGSWEGDDIPLTHLIVPATQHADLSFDWSFQPLLLAEDINFDGNRDLLIEEGYGGGSGGTWAFYRAFLWNKEKAEFTYYPSFPEMLNNLDFENQRMISVGQGGVKFQYIYIYEFVNGQYVESKRLELTESVDGEQTLYYYEMGQLIETHTVTNWIDEAVELYPDLDYWRKG